MSASGYNTRGRVACVKCKQRHKPPVGASCTRVKATRSRKAPTAHTPSSQNLLGPVTKDNPGGGARAETDTGVRPSTTKRKQPSTSEVMEKLDTVLNRFEDIEKRLDNQEKRNSSLSVLSHPSAHSSPKRKEPRVGRHSRSSHDSGELPSMDYLREDSRIQAEVDKRLRQYQNVSREEPAGTSSKFKSGRYRLGDQRVRHMVHWLHEFCTVNENFKMPAYEDINIYQWVQGFAHCILEENDSRTRTYMLEYQSHLMQDAQELNWTTAKRAHAAVLTEIERGHARWGDQASVDRIRQRFTQRALKSQNGQAEEQTKICKRFNEDTCTQAKDHTDGKITYKHACFACFKAVKRHYAHPEIKCNRAKRIASQSGDKQRV